MKNGPDTTANRHPETTSRLHEPGATGGDPEDARANAETGPVTSPFLILPEVAALLRVPPSRVYEWTRTRAIPCYEGSKRLLFDRDEVLTWYRQTHRRERIPSSGPHRRRLR